MYVLVLQIRMWCRIDDEFRFFVKLVGCFSGRFQLSLDNLFWVTTTTTIFI